MSSWHEAFCVIEGAACVASNVSGSNLMEENRSLESNGSSHFRDLSTVGIILYGTETSFSLIANFVVVSLFVCCKRLLRNPHNRCILSLAITDILTSVSLLLSPDFILSEKFYKTSTHSYLTRELYCRIVWSRFLPFTLGVTSLYTSVALSFERWLAVRWSIFYKNSFKIRHMNMLIMVSWIAGITCEFPVILFTEGVYDQPTTSCRWNLSQNRIAVICLSTGLLILQTVLPVVVVTLAYIDIFCGIRASLRFAVSARAENLNSTKRLKKITKVAAITTFVVAICWLPCSVSFFHSVLVDDTSDYPHHWFVMLVSLLTFGNSCINPCIYVFSNPELRSALKDVFFDRARFDYFCHC